MNIEITKSLVAFENFKIRRFFDEKTETWYFSVIDIIAALTDQTDYQTARKYWNKLAERLKNEGSEVVTNCHRLKMLTQDGKMRETDVASAEIILRLIQSVPSKKALFSSHIPPPNFSDNALETRMLFLFTCLSIIVLLSQHILQHRIDKFITAFFVLANVILFFKKCQSLGDSCTRHGG